MRRTLSAATIVNEIGEFRLGQLTLGFAEDTSTLLADACVRSNGLPTLNAALVKGDCRLTSIVKGTARSYAGKLLNAVV